MITGDWIEIFQDFNEATKNNWKKELSRMLRGKYKFQQDILTSNTAKNIFILFKELTITVKHLILEKKETELKELKELLQNDILYTLLMQYENEKISIFDCYCGKLSLLYLKGNSELGNILIDEIFKNVIVQVNHTFFDKYEKYGFKDKAELIRMADLLDSFIMTAVQKRLSSEAFRDFLSFKFSHEEEMVDFITLQYTQYYEQLTQRYLMEHSN